jgi:NTP pyrophosphatase (non-canonical NTP hydrolase)
MLTFEQFQAINSLRSNRDFGCGDWSVADWIVALTGELGEFANVVKKVKRGDLTPEIARPMLKKEIADITAYLFLLASSLDIDLAPATIAKFNEVSDRIGSKIKIEGAL